MNSVHILLGGLSVLSDSPIPDLTGSWSSQRFSPPCSTDSVFTGGTGGSGLRKNQLPTDPDLLLVPKPGTGCDPAGNFSEALLEAAFV